MTDTDGDVFPMSSAQRRLWFLHSLDPTGRAHGTDRWFRVTGELDTGALQEAVDALVARHEALRTVFPDTVHGPVQHVRRAGRITVRILEPAGEPGEAGARRCAAAFLRRPFDIAAGPLLRIAVVPLAPGDRMLVLSLHLLAADGWSQHVLLEELGVLYRAALSGASGRAPLAPPPVQYADWAAWQRERLTSARRAGLLDWWRAELAGAPLLLELAAEPGDGADPGPASPPAGGRIRHVLGTDLSAAVRDLARTRRQSVFTVLVSACAVALGHRAGQQRLLLGLAVANREQPEIQRVLGFFVDTVALHLDLTGDPAFDHLLTRVAGTVAAAHSHRDLPFDELVAALAPPRSPLRSPVVQVNFAHHPAGSLGRLDLHGCAVREVPADSGPGKFELTVRVEESPDDGLVVWGEYGGDALREEDVREVLAAYQEVLRAVTANPGGPLSGLLGVPVKRARARRSNPSSTPPPPCPAGSALERSVARIFGEAVGAAEPGPDQDFFALGGNSAQLAGVLRRLRGELGIPLTLRELYAAPTPAAVAARHPASGGDPAPAAPAQPGTPLT
ncbi:condensation domain-containing protein [Streptomyces sp. NPDC012751]|uniref:condensation domain-containing protein n=1 Tax=Streptomyces sp. NPDC012751 TaxID=3364846 RepID=UPI003675C383